MPIDVDPSSSGEKSRHYERTLQRLIAIATLSAKTIEERMEIGLVDLVRYLDLDFAIVCEQAERLGRSGQPRHWAHYRNFELDPEDTPNLVCQILKEQRPKKKTLQAGVTGTANEFDLSPYRALGIECALTTTILRAGKSAGAIFFGSKQRRDTSFTRFERRIVEIAAAWMEGLLTQDSQMRALRDSEERFEIAMDAAAVGVWDWNLATGEVYCSPRLCEILGLDPINYAKGVQPWSDNIHISDRERVTRALERLLTRQDPYDEEYRYLKSGDTCIWVHAKAQGITNEAGDITRIAGSLEDITHSKNIALALSESEGRLKLAVESANVGIWDWADVSNEKLWWADKTYELLGYAPNEVDPSIPFLRSLVHPEDRERMDAAIAKRLAGGSSVSVEFRLMTKSNGYRWFQTSALISKEKDGRVHRTTGSFKDIHVRKTIDKMLREANADLTRKTDEMEKIMYIVSHDLKSPLVTINGYAAMLADSLEQGIDEETLPSIRRILKAASHMGSLIEDILEVSRIGRIADDIEPVNLEEVVADLRLALEDNTKQARCEWVVLGKLPVLLANRKRLTQALQNLISNALKYGCTQPYNRIVIESSETEDRVQLSVRDFGVGIAPENQQRIFSLFHRLDRSQPGTGLGLAIVERIMALYNGCAKVESTPGKGSVFTLSFPIDMSLS